MPVGIRIRNGLENPDYEALLPGRSLGSYLDGRDYEKSIWFLAIQSRKSLRRLHISINQLISFSSSN